MKEKQEKFQKLYLEFQAVNNTIKQLEKQNSAIEAQLMELLTTSQSLDDLKNVKSGTEILVPVSGGIYAKAELKENDNFIVNVGSNVTLKKNLSETKKIIEDQIKEVRNLQANLMNELQKSTAKAAVLEREIDSIASALKG